MKKGVLRNYSLQGIEVPTTAKPMAQALITLSYGATTQRTRTLYKCPGSTSR